MHMGNLFERYEVAPMKGEDITIGEHFPEVFISESDEIFCYLGICLNDSEDRNRASFMQPYYMKGKHSTNKTISSEIKGFYRLINGCIVLDKYVDNGFYEKHLYKKLYAGVRLASPACCNYAICVDRRDDDEVTRKAFGLTYDELTNLLDSYAKMMGTHRNFNTFPRLTRSIKGINFCDITDLWIPETFPYITFKDSGYDFSHVSLFGFYRHIQLLTGYRSNSLISQALIKSGLGEDVLNKVFDIGQNIYLKAKITRDVLWNGWN